MPDQCRRLHLLAPDRLRSGLDYGRLPGVCPVSDVTGRGWASVRRRLAKGDGLIVIGTEHEELLESLWLRSFRVADEPVRLQAAEGGPLYLRDALLGSGTASFGFVRPPVRHRYRIGQSVVRHNLYHGMDEEYRAEFQPLVEAHDRYGRLVGYPGYMVKHAASALVSGRYRHSKWFVFLLDEPERVQSASRWQRLLEDVSGYCSTGLCLSDLRPDYASCEPGEAVSIRCSVTNAADEPQCGRVRFELLSAAEPQPTSAAEVAFALNLDETSRLSATLRVPDACAGYVGIAACLVAEDRFLYGPDREASRTGVEQGISGVWVETQGFADRGPAVAVDGCRVVIDGEDGFHVGSHYYPTNCFFEGNCRDLRPERVRADFAAMRGHGLRLLRLWVDPVLDEESLRALDAMIGMCQEFGIVVDLTVFNQWVNELGIDVAGVRRRSQVWTWKDYNLSGVALRDMAFQREYVGVLARRYRNVRGLIWNLTNEGAVFDADDEQVADADWLDSRHRELPPPYDSMDLVNQWLAEVKRVLRENGAEQPVISTYVWCGANGSSYSTNRVGDIGTQHDYQPTIPTVAVEDQTCCGKPLLLEEFGVNTDDDQLRGEHYDSILHYAFGLGTAGAVSYEWGVSWMATKLPATAPFLKYPSTTEQTDPRWLIGLYDRWPVGSFGICPYAASYQFGSIYPLTSIPTEAVRHMQRFARVGVGLGPVPRAKQVYLVLPMEWNEIPRPGKGRLRKTALIHETFNRLYLEHVDFRVIGADRLDDIPDTARLAIVPCEDEPAPELREALRVLEERGIETHVGQGDGWVRSEQLDRVPTVGAAGVKMLVDDIDDGTLYVLHNDARDNRRVAIGTVAGEIEIGVDPFGMVGVRCGCLFLLETAGAASVDGRFVIAESTSRCILRSEGDGDLRQAVDLLVIPLTTGEVVFAGEWGASCVDLTADGAAALGPVKTRRRSGHTVVPVDSTLLRYGIRLTR